MFIEKLQRYYRKFWYIPCPVLLTTLHNCGSFVTIKQRVGHDWVTELNWRIHRLNIITVKLHALFSIELLTKRAFPGGSVVKNLPANAGDTEDSGSIPGLGRSTGEGNGNPLQYPCLENSMDWGARKATVQEVAKIWTRLSDFTLFINFWFYYIVLRESSLKGFNLEKMYFLSPRTCSISVSVPKIYNESIILCVRV